MITIGASKPFYAIYNNNNGTITYTGGKQLARLVDLTIAVDGGDPVTFYADNALAESIAAFASGTLTMTVDGMGLDEAQDILGLTAGSDGEVIDVADAVVPELGVGMVKKMMMQGVISYMGIFLHRVKFQLPEEAATTQGETIEFQTQAITATIFKDDSATPAWRTRKVFTTEAAAVTWLKGKLGITP